MKISIPESIFIIALDDEGGRLLAKADKYIHYALGAAAVCELSLLERVRFSSKKVEVQQTEGTGNRILDHVLRTLPKTPQDILHTLQFLVTHDKDVREETVEMLLARGIIERKSMRLFWLPVDERMQNVNYAFEKEIRHDLRRILSKQQSTTPSYTILFTLLYATGLLDEIFPKKDDYINVQKVAQDLLKSSPMDEGLRSALLSLRDFILRNKQSK